MCGFDAKYDRKQNFKLLTNFPNLIRWCTISQSLASTPKTRHLQLNKQKMAAEGVVKHLEERNGQKTKKKTESHHFRF